jgi:integrase
LPWRPPIYASGHSGTLPAPRGGYLEINRFRLRHWYPALRAAGVERRGPYTMRHTFATWAIESGVKLSYLAQL